MLNPHLFTHLFHEGVIVSTRKLVYDSGANEEAIKSLMQAQHKAVMKDLRKGTFDDKIDQYLGGTPGLEPRAGSDAVPAARGERARTDADPEAARAAAVDTASPIEIVNEGLSEPIELPIKRQPDGVPAVSRTGSGDRTIRVDSLQPPPASADIDAPTVQSGMGDMAAAINQANASTLAKVGKAAARAPQQANTPESRDSAPIIEISVDDDEISERLRGIRDTNVEEALQMRDSTSPAAAPRPASHGAATLPAVKPPTRPITPPMVTRQPTQDRKRESQAPPAAVVEPPPSERAERPGQYSMSRKEGAAPIREQTGRGPALKPATAGANPQPVRRGGSGPNQVTPPTGALPRTPTPAGNQRLQPNRPASQPSVQQPRNAQPAIPHPPVSRTTTPPAGSRVQAPPHPSRVQATAPIANRASGPASPASPQPGSGVVMTRPAVIVGAPPKAPVASQQRVRKAREDEGRGFGQGLISEKSLDEVILAYLSEDAEDK